MMSSIIRKSLLLAIPALVLGACASRPPQELVDARRAFERAQADPSAQLNPGDLMVARQTLQMAESFYKEHPDSQATRDMAYIAARRAQLAQVRASSIQATRERAQANFMTQQLAREQLAASQQQMQGFEEQVAVERARREQAEQQVNQLTEKLSKVGSVQQQSRGLVVTLSGAALFGTGQSKLLPSAKKSLDAVVETLRTQKDTGPILIQGYTDSTGSPEKNQTLSQKRAEAVRAYLASKGVPEDKLRAEGYGEQSPVADNTSVRGRAANRRVEIVFQTPGTPLPRGQAAGGGINIVREPQQKGGQQQQDQQQQDQQQQDQKDKDKQQNPPK